MEHPLIPKNLTGKTVIEFGTLHGHYAVELKQRGAQRVVSCDTYYMAETARKLLDAGVEYWASGLADLDYPVRVPEQFDLVLFMNILYHLRNPVQGLETARRACKPDGLVLVETAADQGEAGAIQPPALWIPPHDQPWAKDPTNYFIPNTAALPGLCRMAGLEPGGLHKFVAPTLRTAILCKPMPDWKPFRW